MDAFNFRGTVVLDSKQFRRELTELGTVAKQFQASFQKNFNFNGSRNLFNANRLQPFSNQLGIVNSQINKLGTSVERLSRTFNSGLGLGIAVGGITLLERGLTKGIEKARQFQTAMLSIAAARTSGFNLVTPQGVSLTGPGATRENLQFGYELQRGRSMGINRQLMQRAAQNILTYEEQLGAYLSALPSLARKGITDSNQQVQLSELLATAAKTRGLSGQQVSNQVRAVLSGNRVQNSVLGSALGLTNQDIRGRSGQDLFDFLSERVKGFKAAEGDFENSIEGMMAQLENAFDISVSKIGKKFATGFRPIGKELQEALSGAGADQLAEKIANGFLRIVKALESISKSVAIPVLEKLLDLLASQGGNILLIGTLTKLGSVLFGAIRMLNDFRKAFTTTVAATSLGRLSGGRDSIASSLGGRGERGVGFGGGLAGTAFAGGIRGTTSSGAFTSIADRAGNPRFPLQRFKHLARVEGLGAALGGVAANGVSKLGQGAATGLMTLAGSELLSAYLPEGKFKGLFDALLKPIGVGAVSGATMGGIPGAIAGTVLGAGVAGRNIYRDPGVITDPTREQRKRVQAMNEQILAENPAVGRIVAAMESREGLRQTRRLTPELDAQFDTYINQIKDFGAAIEKATQEVAGFDAELGKLEKGSGLLKNFGFGPSDQMRGLDLANRMSKIEIQKEVRNLIPGTDSRIAADKMFPAYFNAQSSMGIREEDPRYRTAAMLAQDIEAQRLKRNVDIQTAMDKSSMQYSRAAFIANAQGQEFVGGFKEIQARQIQSRNLFDPTAEGQRQFESAARSELLRYTKDFQTGLQQSAFSLRSLQIESDRLKQSFNEQKQSLDINLREAKYGALSRDYALDPTLGGLNPRGGMEDDPVRQALDQVKSQEVRNNLRDKYYYVRPEETLNAYIKDLKSGEQQNVRDIYARDQMTINTAQREQQQFPQDFAMRVQELGFQLKTSTERFQALNTDFSNASALLKSSGEAFGSIKSVIENFKIDPIKLDIKSDLQVQANAAVDLHVHAITASPETVSQIMKAITPQIQSKMMEVLKNQERMNSRGNNYNGGLRPNGLDLNGI